MEKKELQNAIEEAKKSEQDIPVGCVIKFEGKIIAQAHNMREELNDITSHAEILAIKEAQQKLKSSRLQDCEMYVTLEPCPMCGWAILQSGIKTLYFGAYNPQYGSMGSNPDVNLLKISNSKIKVYGGIMEEECKDLLDNFFTGIRK